MSLSSGKCLLSGWQRCGLTVLVYSLMNISLSMSLIKASSNYTSHLISFKYNVLDTALEHKRKHIETALSSNYCIYMFFTHITHISWKTKSSTTTSPWGTLCVRNHYYLLPVLKKDGDVSAPSPHGLRPSFITGCQWFESQWILSPEVHRNSRGFFSHNLWHERPESQGYVLTVDLSESVVSSYYTILYYIYS